MQKTAAPIDDSSAGHEPAGDAVVPDAVHERLPVVALVGRPNVGKSSLFNRISRTRKAVVDNTPGVTRDRVFARVSWRRRPFVVVDTGGMDPVETDGVVGRVQRQTRLAIAEADLIVFLFDGREGVNPTDAQAVDLLRRSEKPVLYAVNKIDGDKQELAVHAFHTLGVDPIFPISAAHGRGVAELLDRVLAACPARPTVDTEAAAREADELRLAIVGRPNVGKSSLLNRLVGAERSIVDATPGTTRDAVDSRFAWRGRNVVLVDTAGVRRRTRVHGHIEQASVLIALKALERAEVGLLVFDAQEGLTDQDARLMRYGWERGRGLLLVANKWDLIPSDRKHQARFSAALHREFPATQAIPLIFLSALTGARVQHVLPAALRVARARRSSMPTTLLNRKMQEWTARHPAPLYRGKPVRFYYATQVETAPPKLAVYTSAPRGVTANYVRYLENQLRGEFDLDGTPLRLDFRVRRAPRGVRNDSRRGARRSPPPRASSPKGGGRSGRK